MNAYQAGDRDSADALIREVSPILLRFFLGLGHSRNEAEELLQEAWLRIHKARATWRPGERLMPWVYAIARYARVDSIRRQVRVRRHEEELTAGVEATASQPDTVEQQGEAFALLARLPESQRETIVMLKVDGMSLEEVARATSSSVGAVKQRAHRAYEKLRELLDPARRTRGGTA